MPFTVRKTLIVVAEDSEAKQVGASLHALKVSCKLRNRLTMVDVVRVLSMSQNLLDAERLLPQENKWST